MNPTVIYHSADFDGIFCREIARKFLPDANLIGWNHGEPKIPMPPEGTVYILDLSPDCLSDESLFQPSRIVWIDHHKTSIEKWAIAEIPGYRIDGVAACRLAWQWFLMVDGNTPRSMRAGGSEPISPAGVLPMIQDFKNREVEEPLAVRLAGEYDIWDKRDPRAELLQYGLRTDSNPSGVIQCLLNGDPMVTIDKVLDLGYVAQMYARNTDADIVKNRSFLLPWEGLTFLCLNSARFNSLTFAVLDTPTNGHDALMGFCWDGKQWQFSLYHAKHRTDLDLSAIAKKYGGGGHRGACGFTCAKLPFTLGV